MSEITRHRGREPALPARAGRGGGAM